jgi:hypothetical protein
MGMDARKAMSDFSLMLANNSIMRLDQFGISSGRVRERIHELQAATDGLSRSDAFKMAVLEEGAAALERLGSAAFAAETPMNRLAASVQNMAQSFAGDFTTGLNSTIGILEIATGNNQVQLQIESTATANATAYAQRYHEALGDNFAALDTANLLFKSALTNITANPALTATEATQNAFNALTYNETVGISDEELQRMYSATFTMLEQKTAAEAAAKAQQEQAEALAESARQAILLEKYLAISDDRKSATLERKGFAAQELAEQAAGNRHANTYWDAYTTHWQEKGAQVLADQAAANRHVSAYWDAYTTHWQGEQEKFDAQSNLGDFFNQFGMDGQTGGVSPFMTSGAADEIANQFKSAEEALTRLKELNKDKLISDDDLARASGLVERLQGMSSEAQKAADAFNNLKLSDVFGQTGGGMKGEISDLIIGQMKASGATKGQIAAMQAELDRGSGRETETSEEMKNVIVPMLAKMSAKQAAVAMTNLDALLKEAVLQGLSPDQIQALMLDMAGKTVDLSGSMSGYMSMMFGGGRGAGDGSVGAGSIFDDEKKRGKSGGMSNVATDMTSINKDSTAIDKSMKNINDSTTAASKAASIFQKAIDAIPDVKGIVFKFTADDPQGLVGLVKALTGGALTISDYVRDNGGNVPGTGSSTHNR